MGTRSNGSYKSGKPGIQQTVREIDTSDAALRAARALTNRCNDPKPGPSPDLHKMKANKTEHIS